MWLVGLSIKHGISVLVLYDDLWNVVIGVPNKKYNLYTSDGYSIAIGLTVHFVQQIFIIEMWGYHSTLIRNWDSGHKLSLWNWNWTMLIPTQHAQENDFMTFL